MRSGIASAAQSVGATVLLPEERKCCNYRMNGELLSVWPIYTPILEADKVINIPIVKHHNYKKWMATKYYLLFGLIAMSIFTSLQTGILDPIPQMLRNIK